MTCGIRRWLFITVLLSSWHCFPPWLNKFDLFKSKIFPTSKSLKKKKKKHCQILSLWENAECFQVIFSLWENWPGENFSKLCHGQKNELSGKDVFLDYILPYCDSGRSFSWQCCLQHRLDTLSLQKVSNYDITLGIKEVIWFIFYWGL